LTPYSLAEEQRGQPFRCTTCLQVFVADAAVQEAPPVVQPLDAVAAEAPKIVQPVDEEPYVAMPVATSPPPRRRRFEKEPIPAPKPRGKKKLGGERIALLITAVITALLVGGAAAALGYRFWRNPWKSQAKSPVNFVGGTPKPQINLAGETPQPQGVVIQPASQHIDLGCNDQEVNEVYFSDEATHQATVVRTSRDRSVRVDRYDLKAGKRLSGFALNVLPFVYRRMSLSPKATHFAYEDKQNNLVVLSAEDGREAARWRPYDSRRAPPGGVPPGQLLARVDFVSEDRLLTVNQAGGIGLWSFPNLQPVFDVAGLGAQEYRDPNSGICLSLDRQTLAMFNGDGFDLRSTATGDLLRRTGRAARWNTIAGARASAFSPDEKTVAAVLAMQSKGASAEVVLASWDVGTGQLVDDAVLPERGADKPGTLTWWGSNYLVPCAFGGLPKQGHLFTWPGGRHVRQVELGPLKGYGLLAPNSPDGRLWYVTGSDDAATAFLTTVDVPENELRAGPEQPDERWWLTAKGVIK
jgi:hypothetical protein